MSYSALGQKIKNARLEMGLTQKELAQQDKFTLKLVNNEVDTCAEELYQVICQRAGLAK